MSKFFLVSVFSVLFCSFAMAQTDVSADIKKANKVFMDAVSKGDQAALAGLYTADAKLFPANSAVIDGKEAIGGFWAATIKMGIKKVIFETTSALKYGDIAIEEGKYSLFVEGDHLVDQGKYIVNWKNENGKWKVYRDIWNNSSPAPKQKAATGDTVLIILNYVKADKVAQFEDYNKKYLFPAGKEVNAATESTIRMQKPVIQNKDSTYTYIYFVDPFVGTNNYDMEYTLKAKFGEKKAQEYFKMYIDCLKDGKSKSIWGVETDW